MSQSSQKSVHRNKKVDIVKYDTREKIINGGEY